MKKDKDIIPYENQKALSQFLSQPEVKIAELITGALAMGKSEAILISGRLVQGALKGNLMKQLGRELNYLKEKGMIEEDYAKEKYAFQTLSEILSFIDDQSPDKDKFKIIKSLFYSIIDKKAPQGSDMLRYQLFQICKDLKSSQLLTLQAAYELRDENISDASSWMKKASTIAGHNSAALVEHDEKILIEENLITKRRFSDESGVFHSKGMGRLTDLGLSLINAILDYNDFAEENN